jgi:hypothetical protein
MGQPVGQYLEIVINRKECPQMRSALVSLVLLLATIPAISQSKNGTATANGQCSIAISGDNNTVPTAKEMESACGVGKEQLEKIITLLNGVLTKRDLKQLNAKLDELIQIANKPVQICSNNIMSACVAGDNFGTVIGPVFGASKAPPPVLGLEVTIIPAVPASPAPLYSDDPKIHLQQMKDYKTQYLMGLIHEATNPGLFLKFHVDGTFQNPMFLIHCDNPCTGVGSTVAKNESAWSQGNNSFLVTRDPNTFLLVLGDYRMLTSDLTVSVSVLSTDKTPLVTATVESYVQ